MIKIHKEGIGAIIISFLFLAVVMLFASYWHVNDWIWDTLFVLCVLTWFMVIRFFRYPFRKQIVDESAVFSPCDGEVVVIEEVYEPEYLKTQCLQVSVFMSPLNVHANWYPVSGEVEYVKYHPGKYLVAWHPKSSCENERTTVVVRNDKGKFLFRQVAGAMARRIVCYAHKDLTVEQNTELGFIKFGSRVDVYLPLGSKIQVALGQKVVGKVTHIALV